jgi:uncharacterized membrane protein
MLNVFSNTLVFVASSSVLGISYLLTMEGIWNEWGTTNIYLSQIIIISILTGIVLLIQGSKYYFKNFQFTPNLLLIESTILLYLILLSWFLLFVPEINEGLLLFLTVVIFNLIFLMLSITIAYVGITLKNYSLVNLGLFGTILLISTRYFDLFLGMIDTGLFFAITGVLLLLGGVAFERFRRRLLDRFDLNEG